MNTKNTKNEIYFNFSYYALRLLGKGLYSNAWTAIAELVANGFDANAKHVKVYINATNKEFCSIEVNTSKEGSLRVIVMTADGNVVKYLENGRKPQGQYYYFWNGTNNSGKSVARGIYFIRIVGSGIDETRKVMVVK